MVQRWHHRRDVVFQTGGLVYDNGAKKNVEGSGRMMSYNVLNICWPYGIHMAI